MSPGPGRGPSCQDSLKTSVKTLRGSRWGSSACLRMPAARSSIAVILHRRGVDGNASLAFRVDRVLQSGPEEAMNHIPSGPPEIRGPFLPPRPPFQGAKRAFGGVFALRRTLYDEDEVPSGMGLFIARYDII